MYTMEEGPSGGLYRLDPDFSVTRIDSGIICSNGPCWSLYVTSMAKPPLPRFPDDGVLRGSLFAITGLGIKGVAEPRFAG